MHRVGQRACLAVAEVPVQPWPDASRAATRRWNWTRTRGWSLSARGTSPAMSTAYSRGCLTRRREVGDGLGAEGLGRDRLGLLRPRRLPGGHHAGVGAGGRMDVLELVRSRRQVDLALEPRVVDRSVPARGRHHDLPSIERKLQSWLDVKKR